MWPWILRHILQETGISTGASRAYNAWSGFGSDIGEVAIIGGLIGAARNHNLPCKRLLALGSHEYEMDGRPTSCVGSTTPPHLIDFTVPSIP